LQSYGSLGVATLGSKNSEDKISSVKDKENPDTVFGTFMETQFTNLSTVHDKLSTSLPIKNTNF